MGSFAESPCEDVDCLHSALRCPVNTSTLFSTAIGNFLHSVCVMWRAPFLELM